MSSEDYTGYCTVETRGSGLIGVMSCRRCGAAVMPTDEIDAPGIHDAWHDLQELARALNELRVKAVEKLRLEPTDILVVKVPDDESAYRASEFFTDRFPDLKRIVIFPEGSEITKVEGAADVP